MAPSGTEEITAEPYLDSRDIIARIDYLETMIEAGKEDAAEGPDEYEIEELAALKALADEASGYAADWQYGEQLIRDDIFVDYAETLADDIGAINSGRDGSTPWPLRHIDWEAAADELKQDYTQVSFLGFDYWIR